MAGNREATGLAALRVCLGVFTLADAFFKLRWLINSEGFATRASEWAKNANPWNTGFLHHVVLPYVAILSRVVLIGEVCVGLGLLLGIFTRPLAIIAFLMVLVFQFATGTLFHPELFVRDGLGLPLLGGLLALAIGAGRLPWSLKS